MNKNKWRYNRNNNVRTKGTFRIRKFNKKGEAYILERKMLNDMRRYKTIGIMLKVSSCKKVAELLING